MGVRWTQAKMREVAEEERAQLGLGVFEPLDPYRLAEEHGIPVYAIDELADCDRSDRAVQHFTQVRKGAWSAALVPIGRRRLIIENRSHAPVRRRSSIGHELGHFLLEHPFDTILLTETGCRRFDPALEKQAMFVAGELLVPWKAAVKAAFDDWTNEQVSQQFGVSQQFAQMRMYGARAFARNARIKQGSQ